MDLNDLASAPSRHRARCATRYPAVLVAALLAATSQATASTVTVSSLLQLSGASAAQRSEALYQSLMSVDSVPLTASTARQAQMLEWLHSFSEPRDIVVTRETLPYVTLGAIRHVYIRADTQWQGNGLLERLLEKPDQYYWNTCSYLVEMFTHVMEEFEVPTRPLQHFRTANFTHATCEFYSFQREDWVFADLLYGAIFVDGGSHVASFALLADEMTSHGVTPAEQTVWEHSYLRFYSVFDTTPVPSPVPVNENLDKRAYSVVVDYYFPLTAVRYDDVLYYSPSSRPIQAPVSSQHRGRWLVVDASHDPDLGLTRYDPSFWTWFHDRYHLRDGGNYTYDVLRLVDGFGGLDSFDPTSRLLLVPELTPQGPMMSVYDRAMLETARVFRLRP